MALKSEVWHHFLKESKTAVRCKHCSISMSFCGNTTNLWNHVSVKHGIKPRIRAKSSKNVATNSAQAEDNFIDDPPVIEIEDSSEPSTSTVSRSSSRQIRSSQCISTSNTVGCKRNRHIPPAKRQRTIDDVIDRANAFSDGGMRSAVLNEALVYMVCKDHMPLWTPEREGFCYFAKKAVPLWKPPCRQTLTRMIENKFDVLKAKVIAKISLSRNYTLTSDVWTNSNTSESYLGLTLHYLWEQKMQSATFGVEPLTEAHTSAYLSERIRNICWEWDIDLNKVNSVVTDNGENIVKAVRDLFGAAKHIPCFAHTLNLIPNAALGLNSKKEENVRGVPSLISKVKDIVTFFKRSVKASDELRRLQYANGKTEGTALRLIQDVLTRWNSTYLMLQRFLELSDLIGLTLLKFPQGPDMLTGAETSSIRVIAQILAPLMQATVELSAEKTPTTSKVIAIVHLMRQSIAMVEPATNDHISEQLKVFILEGLDKRFGKAESMRQLAMATMLDPRFKKIHFQSPLVTAQTITSLATAAKEVIRMKNVESVSSQNNAILETTNTNDPNDIWSLHDSLLKASLPQELDTAGGIPVELRQYLSRPVVNRQTDPFEAWGTLKSEYPNVYEIMLDYLPTIATSVPSERLFSGAGLIATELRNRLTGSHLSQLLFLSSVPLSEWS